MTTRSDREQIGVLNGVTSSSSKAAWKNTPTPITVPANSPSNGSRRPGANPYNANPNYSRKPDTHVSAPVGNVTSRRTLLGSIGLGGGRPGKKRRVEESSQSSSHPNLRAALINGNYSAHDRDVIICVDDDDDDQDLRNHESRYHKRPSSDELNITTEPSSSTGRLEKFKYINVNQRKTESKPMLAPEPPENEWLEVHYAEGDQDSDSIESFSDLDRAPPSGIVKDAVRKFENLGNSKKPPPKIDLAQKQKPRAKQRMKGKASTSRSAGFTQGPNIVDFMRSSTLSRKTDERLPIEAFYINSDLRSSTEQEFELTWTSSPSLTIKSTSYSFKIPHVNCTSITFSMPDEMKGIEPVIQINTEQLVTIKFDVTSPLWSPKKYQRFLDSLSRLKPQSVLINVLWREAQQLAESGTSEGHSKFSSVQSNSRMKELEAIRERKTRDGYSLSGPRKRKEPPGHTPPESPLTDISKSIVEDSEMRTLPAYSKRRNAQSVGSPSLRRSTRNTMTTRTPVAADQDEVILVYPQGTPGAVNITNADLGRLEPGEFLNDTLIEFGLKFWLKELEQTNPELASQIHIFNSFFYKKLNQKDPQQAYESVRKWTSKFDIFQKKYIIVPINEHLHWYLAIIYEPEHILSPIMPEVPSIRKETRSSRKANAANQEPPETTLERRDTKDEQNPTPSEAEVERNLNDDFQNSCTIESLDDDGDDELLLQSEPTDYDDDRSSAALSYVSQEGEEVVLAPRSLEGPSGRQGSPRPTMPGEVPDSTEESESRKGQSGINPSLFYHHLPKNGKRKRKDEVTRDPDIAMKETKPEEDEVFFVERPKTYIFTMDSLGTRHPQAIKRLANYLKMEAQDKKGVQGASLAMGKFASVPVQPNFCDCGVYLLHFAETFMTQPKEYYKNILSQKPKLISNKERQDAWLGDKVGHMRTDMIDHIKRLSAEWKKGRAASVEAKKTEQHDGDSDIKMVDSDTDVELVEAVGLTKQSKSARRK
ncbi:hypothetical protein CPB84DRAFT_1843311 [Gymnopilus junonius]|uniref:Ubiquitin-like protease family profile domain-containing protein n=1 Tax=Gymnopilus junonius TaxID=109634 RepID=A0A9P5NZA2_GYMJU|nr:hypothetical protein CPB84DRAFT_1843311 [Gymnopilus junonius]